MIYVTQAIAQIIKIKPNYMVTSIEQPASFSRIQKNREHAPLGPEIGFVQLQQLKPSDLLNGPEIALYDVNFVQISKQRMTFR